MGNCCSGGSTDTELPVLPPPETTRVAPSASIQLQPQAAARASSTSLHRPRSRAPSVHAAKPPREATPYEQTPRSRVVSAPQKLQPQRDIEWTKSSSSSSPNPNPRSRAQSVAPPRKRNRSDPRPPSSDLPRPPAASFPGRRALTSTVRQVLSDHPRFRILVVGKKGSGKSSLIKTVFKVNVPVTAALGRASGKPDVNFEYRPDDNRYLIVHECSGLEQGDAQGLQAIREFISTRTDQSRSALERLHAVWICVPASDLVNGSIEEGIQDILAMKGVPVIVAFTKFDLLVSQSLTDSESGNTPQRNRAYIQCEQACRSMFGKAPQDVPAEIVSRKFSDLIDRLIVTTDRFIIGPRVPSRSRSSVQGPKPRIAPVPLTWSAAVRVCQDIIIQASIEVGRSRYWRSLRSSLDFADQPLKNCVHIIHVDIIEIWNLNDKTSSLLSIEFMENMSHVVKDLAGLDGGGPMSPDPGGSGDRFAEWVYDIYRGSQDNVRCVMGYIVDLTVILDGVFRVAANNVRADDVRSVLDRHVKSGRRDRIHRDIRSFVTEAVKIRSSVPQKDLVLEKIIDLITQYCVAPSL